MVQETATLAREDRVAREEADEYMLKPAAHGLPESTVAARAAGAEERGGSDADDGSDGEEGAPAHNSARELQAELAAEAATRPRSLVDSLGWGSDEAAANELRDLGDITQLVLECLTAAAAAGTPAPTNSAPTPPAAALAPATNGAAGGKAVESASEPAPAAEEPPSAKERLVAALRARLFDAQGEALLEVGPILPDRADECFALVKALCEGEIGGRAYLVLTREAGRGKQRRVRLDILVRLPPSEQRHLNLRVAVIGNVDAGKSTLVGVLVGGALDNGRGSARLRVLKHKHEAETGRTSSIAEDQHLGFDQLGNVVNAQHGLLAAAAAASGAAAAAAADGASAGGGGGAGHSEGGGGGGSSGGGGGPGGGAPVQRIAQSNWQDVVQRSSKVVSFIDLAGHERYLKTTMFGMTAHDPDYGLVVVGANHGVTRMTKEHLGVAIALHVPVLIVVTKSDLAPDNVLKETLQQLQRLLRVPGARKRPFVVRGMEDVVVASRAFRDGFVAPIFTVSNVSGDSMDLLHAFINLMPARKRWAQRADGAVEFLIDQFFNVPGIGTVIAGTLVSGQVTVGMQLQIGPDHTGAFKPVLIKSIHHMRTPVQRLLTGQSGAFLMRSLKRKEHLRNMGLRKGMVLIGEHSEPRATWRFTCDVLVLHSSTTMRCNYQPVLHVRNVRQSARIVRMDREVLRTGAKASIEFEFLFRPEYIALGSRLIFREGKTKGIGNVTHLFPPDEPHGVALGRQGAHGGGHRGAGSAGTG